MTHALARWSRAEEGLKRIEAAADELAKAFEQTSDTCSGLADYILNRGDVQIDPKGMFADLQRAGIEARKALSAYRKVQQEI